MSHFTIKYNDVEFIKKISYKFIKSRFSITDKHLSEAAHTCSRSILTSFIRIIQNNYCLTQYYCIFIYSDIKFILQSTLVNPTPLNSDISFVGTDYFALIFTSLIRNLAVRHPTRLYGNKNRLINAFLPR